MSAESHLGLAAVPADPLGNEIPPLAVHDPLPESRLPLLFSLPLLPFVSWALHTDLQYIHILLHTVIRFTSSRAARSGRLLKLKNANSSFPSACFSFKKTHYVANAKFRTN
jgi:hypothetical protein